MVKKYNTRLLKLSKNFEAALSIVILILVLLGMMDLVRSVYQAYIVDFSHPVKYSQLNSFLAEALLLVIGVELVVMLSLHIPGVLIEVLLYAIARKLILLPKSIWNDRLTFRSNSNCCIICYKKVFNVIR